jgi:Gpi18-like mannosyltransferase
MKSKLFWKSLLAFFFINSALYIFIFAFGGKVPFNNYNYKFNAYHYLSDAQVNGGKTDFLRSLGQYDAQYFLKIADVGYPYLADINMHDKKQLDSLSYAFFPLYPLTISVVNVLVKNVELSAFLLAILLIIADFTSVYFIVGKLYGEKIAIKTNFLLFLFPFSIFYRSYFSEGLFLLILLWFSFFLIKRKMVFCAFLLGLLAVTRGVGLFMFLPFLYYLGKELKLRKITVQKGFVALIIAVIPIILWILYCFLQTGNGIYFLTIRTTWASLQMPFLHNILVILSFPKLPLHGFHYSQIDVLVIIFVFCLLVLSRKSLKPELWIISFLLWLGPLLITDTMSFSRYQIVSFPLFIYLSQKLSGFKYGILLAFFLIGLFFVSLFFINWYWIG